MHRQYLLHDDLIETAMVLFLKEAERAEKLGDTKRAEDLKADYGTLEHQFPNRLQKEDHITAD